MGWARNEDSMLTREREMRMRSFFFGDTCRQWFVYNVVVKTSMTVEVILLVRSHHFDSKFSRSGSFNSVMYSVL